MTCLDPEQQEALEKLQVAAEQFPNPIDEGSTDETQSSDPATTPGRENVSAETSPPSLDWCQRQADALALLAETMLAETMLAGGARTVNGADRQLLHVHIPRFVRPDGKVTALFSG